MFLFPVISTFVLGEAESKIECSYCEVERPADSRQHSTHTHICNQSSQAEPIQLLNTLHQDLHKNTDRKEKAFGFFWDQPFFDILNMSVMIQ